MYEFLYESGQFILQPRKHYKTFLDQEVINPSHQAPNEHLVLQISLTNG